MNNTIKFLEPVSSLKIKDNKRKIVPDKCYKPDWCNCNKDQFLYEKAMCLSNALFNFKFTLINQAVCYSKLGLVEKANKVYFELNRINYIVAYLFFVYVQVYLNKNENFEDYISCKELENIKKQLNCIGFDITCVYKCLDLCQYTTTCTEC